MARKRRKPTARESGPPPPDETKPLGLRIVGGRFRGRKLKYTGDPRTRPMKDRVRQAVFDLLGPAVKEKHAIDLFAGTGAQGLEAISRGASAATLIERHYPTANLIRENVALLGLDNADVVAMSAFVWIRRRDLPRERPWVVFVSPPYDYYVEQQEQMLDLIARLIAAAPLDSLLVVEADTRFDFRQLPFPDAWDVRPKPPAVVGILQKTPEMERSEEDDSYAALD